MSHPQNKRYLEEMAADRFGDPLAVRDACGVGLIASRSVTPSRDILDKAFTALKNLAHRGAIDADGRTGDGAGILTPIPKAFYVKKAKEAGIAVPDPQDFAVAMIFFPQKERDFKECQEIFSATLVKHGIEEFWTRKVPVDENVLGSKALAVKPRIFQKYLRRPEGLSCQDFETLLFLVRKEMDFVAKDRSIEGFYVPTMSAKTIVHKGLFVGDQVKNFYVDLLDPDFVAPFAIFHQRFSTNTFPTWALAHPFRTLAHNGEINTLRANRNWMMARSIAEQPRSWIPEQHVLANIIIAGRSDSASFDNMLEAYVHAGRSILHAVVHMLPEAWQHHAQMDPKLKAFYEYHACLSEPWDGPAAVAFTDSRFIGAIVDRNGLRPARYKITKDHFFVSSEMGCLDFNPEDVEENGKLSPGKIIALDLENKTILKNDEIKSFLATQKPYLDWVSKHVVGLDEALAKRGKNPYDEPVSFSEDELATLQTVFGYTKEDIDLILTPMMSEGKEPVGSMGDDTPLAPFSEKPRLLYTYFKQLFAQVTNPAIDPIREDIVMSLRMYMGKSGNIFEESPTHARQLRVRSPIVTKSQFDEITQNPFFPTAILSATFSAKEGPGALEEALVVLCQAAEKAIDEGHYLIVLTDRDVSATNAPIPMLLAVASVHHHLIRAGKRLSISLLVETGEAREVHHFAALIGFGASVIYPYLALQVVGQLAKDEDQPVYPRGAIQKFVHAAEAGILKIMSKMGISTLQSYHAAQLFEIVGLKDAVIRNHFTGTPAGLTGGVGLPDIARDYLTWHARAFVKQDKVLDIGGFYRFRREGEYHAFNPEVVKALHQAVSQTDLDAYHKYTELVNKRVPMTIRDLLKIKTGSRIPVTEVEDGENIVKRFCTPGISYGAISKEVHEDFAIAMNRLGAKSDSGEGGEDSERYEVLPSGDSKNSAIKQVASGRFGVTAYYLSRAGELEIKIAQGAKPGEGGQLPGHKVSEDIARIRHSTPGVTLISPPPHHDIYSIEDLSQLIYDLKRANPKAKVCVKLVSEAGIGTIAAGVAKAHADVILISGHDGGTGAAPLSSIKHAGLPWELGLAEAQQILVKNSLRSRVVLRADGGFKTGLDVVKAALFGAEEFGFGTAAMLAAGCVMVRQCHLNTCPVGVATQNPALRAKYKGTPERIVNLFLFIAEEVRLILAEMGYKTLDEIVGRVDLLEQIQDIANPKLKRLNLKKLIAFPYTRGTPIKNTIPRNDWTDDERFDEPVLKEASELFQTGYGHVTLAKTIRNTQRAVGTRLSYHVVDRFGPQGFPDGSLTLELTGTAGQSFGAFLAKTLTLKLEGEANDYVGKGLSGGMIVLKPPRAARFKPEDNIICGNTCLYGATSGKLFVNGRAGERFAVRGSGADAVVEGVGDHGCEYMTGGRVLVLGEVGLNFGAGMTGGTAAVWDPKKVFAQKMNPSEITVFDVDWNSPEGVAFKALLEEHVRFTGSPLGARLLAAWDDVKKEFICVVPKEVLARQKAKVG